MFWRRYFGLSRNEMRQVQSTLWRNVALADGDSVELQSFGFDRAKLLEFVTGVIKWRAKSEYLPELFEVVKEWSRYNLADTHGAAQIAEIVDDFIIAQLIDRDASGSGFRARGMWPLEKDERQQLLQGLRQAGGRLQQQRRGVVTLDSLGPWKATDVQSMLCTILDLEIASPYARPTPSARVVLAKIAYAIPVTTEEIGELQDFVESCRTFWG